MRFRTLWLLVCLLFELASVQSQDLLIQDFSTWPPAGWTIQNQGSNWSTDFSVQAGGTPPEARLLGNPVFFNVTRLISPSLNLTGFSHVKVEFRHALDVVAQGYSIGLATRTGNGPWTIVWSYSGANPIPVHKQTVSINNVNTNQPNFQFCLYFLGNSSNLNGWYLDDIRLFVPPVHDIELVDYLSPEHSISGTNYIPKVYIVNQGLVTENAIPLTCKVYDTLNTLIYNVSTYVNNLQSGAGDTVTFSNLVLQNANSVYRIVVYTALLTDFNKDNDTVKSTFNTYLLTERKYVLLEIGTATWCSHCPAAAEASEGLQESNKKIVELAYHTNSGDPFNNASSDARLAYYSILGFPTAVFDGVEKHTGSTNVEVQYNALYVQRKQLGTPFDLSVFGTVAGNNVIFHVILRKLAPVNFPALRLMMALTESNISFPWFDQTHVNHVVRDMYPNASGLPVDLVTNTGLAIPVSITLDSGWTASNCEIVVFLQDTLTKEVYQVDKAALSDLIPYSLSTLNGSVQYDNLAGTPVSGADIQVYQGYYPVGQLQSDSLGHYQLGNLLPGKYTLRGGASGPWGGGNAADAFLIMKEFVIGEEFTSLRAKAADTDNSGYINTIDALNVMRRFVGFINSFPRGDWILEDTPHVLMPGLNLQKNIKGICTGDVDGSFIPW